MITAKKIIKYVEDSERELLYKTIRGEVFLDVYCQPIVNMVERLQYGCEVLSAWPEDSLLGAVSPFTVVDKYNLGPNLDMVALKTILAKLTQIQSDVVFINCYMSNLALLYDLLNDVMEKTPQHLQKSEVVVEIDFSTELVNVSSVIRDIESINSLDFVTFAIDDIGKYDVSKDLITLFNPSFVKADISVIKGIAKDFSKQETLRKIMEKINGIDLIAEGIETFEDMDYLMKANVIYGQGYYFSHPKKI